MAKQGKVAVIFLMLAMALVGGGCSTGANQPVAKIESGVVNQDYRGIANPLVVKETKLTELEQEEGIQKITIKCGVQINAPGALTTENPADSGSTNTEGAGGEEVARPKI